MLFDFTPNDAPDKLYILLGWLSHNNLAHENRITFLFI